MVEGKTIIRLASDADFDIIVWFYINHMFDSYLLRFGYNFVRQYLRIIVKSKNCISLVAEDNGIVGFIMAALNSRKLFMELILDWKLFLCYLMQLFIRPVCFLQALGLIFYPFKAYIRKINAELLFISISPEARRKKIAGDLIISVFDIMKQNNTKKVQVSTSNKNVAINSLLKKMGFKQEKVFSLFKKPMYLYSYELY